jgi:YesN/AraC family two-component response regulator
MISQFDLKNLSLLYVEDDDITRGDLMDFLRWKFDTVYEAKDGREGLDLFKRHKPDIVITDIKMPVMDGIEMAAEIKRTDSGAPIIITTAFCDIGYVARAIELEVDAYLQKPILHEHLLNAVYRVALYKFADRLLDLGCQ